MHEEPFYCDLDIRYGLIKESLRNQHRFTDVKIWFLDRNFRNLIDKVINEVAGNRSWNMPTRESFIPIFTSRDLDLRWHVAGWIWATPLNMDGTIFTCHFENIPLPSLQSWQHVAMTDSLKYKSPVLWSVTWSDIWWYVWTCFQCIWLLVPISFVIKRFCCQAIWSYYYCHVV